MVRVCAVTVALLLTLGACPTAHAQRVAVGEWRGTSLCVVRPSPCNDERVVYRIAQLTQRDSLSLVMRKIVNGQEEDMAVLGCRFVDTSGSLTCAMSNGSWRFVVRGDSLTGDLRLPNETKYRDIRTARVH